MSIAATSKDAGARAMDARTQATLRFATGTTGAFVVGQALGLVPTFLGAVLAAVLLANLPGRPSLKLGGVLVLVMALSSLFAFVASSLLHGLPAVLFGVVGVCMLLAFHAIAAGKPMLPFLLLLVCLAVVPVIAMLSPAVAGVLAAGLAQGMLVAMLAVWAAYALWPRPLPPTSATPPGNAATPLTIALVSVAVVLPLMLCYMLLGWTDALPVLLATIMLVMTFDIARGQQQAVGMILGNFGGGMLGIVVYGVFQTTPSLWFLSLLLFLVMLAFGWRIAAGGPMAAILVIACNGMLIIFGSALDSDAPVSAWVARVFQFALAGAFAVGMLQLATDVAFRKRPARTTG